jgi:carboxypeptidase family protein
MRTFRERLLTALMVCAFACTVAWAQGTGQINGVVKDQSGAVLPGAEVTATQTETAVARTSVSNETGNFILPNLPVGPYRIEVALPGFRTYIQTGIVLQVNGNPTINAVLEVGQVSEQVEVQADATMVETRSTGIGSVIENQRVLELPLNGRKAEDSLSD